MDKRMRMIGFAAALALGTTAAWAKLPPPPPMDDAAKAAAAEKKAAAAAKAKAELELAQDVAVKNYQANMKKSGKPMAKAATAAPQKK
jgi:hypothetical protein